MSSFYYKLNWPSLPKYLHNELISYAQSAKNIRPTTRRGGDKYHHYSVPKHIETWCRENLPITDEYQVILQRFFDTTFIPKHIDGQRAETYNYILSEPGPTTRWFDIRGRVIDSFVFPCHQWYYLKVDEWHDVINIKNERLALSLHIPFK